MVITPCIYCFFNIHYHHKSKHKLCLLKDGNYEYGLFFNFPTKQNQSLSSYVEHPSLKLSQRTYDKDNDKPMSERK